MIGQPEWLDTMKPSANRNKKNEVIQFVAEVICPNFTICRVEDVYDPRARALEPNPKPSTNSTFT